MKEGISVCVKLYRSCKVASYPMFCRIEIKNPNESISQYLELCILSQKGWFIVQVDMRS